MMSEVNRIWRLRNRPVGDITDDVLSFEDESIPEPGDGEFLFRLNYLSLDPTNRIWMSDMDQYMPPVELDAPMRGVVCGTVVKSHHPDYAEGTIVSGLGVWADYQIGTPQIVSPMGDTGPIPVVDAFSTFAVVGPTAYFGLLDIGEPKEGETVVVSAAAGAVGSIVGQIAKIKGCRVVGLAGTKEKCAWIQDDLGFDVAINYRTEDVPKTLAAACPDGIDVYFDNVGGEILDACLKLMNFKGRIPTCGLISQYNATEPVPGPYNYVMIVMQRLRVEGFIVLDFAERYPEAIAALGQWMAEGKIKVRTEIVDGLENALQTVKKLYTGANTGKLMIRVKDV
ncbi:NADP-dependent oxidoreductase [candidate division KSB1 bacterium]|nr:NADP-dependent oxidoreductase [candidate division KSB1 bacterium]